MASNKGGHGFCEIADCDCCPYEECIDSNLLSPPEEIRRIKAQHEQRCDCQGGECRSGECRGEGCRTNSKKSGK